MREVDEPIPEDERLFRSIGREDVDGDHLLPGAIELPAMSVNRSKYDPDPRNVIRGNDTGVAVTTSRQLPTPMTSPGDVTYEFFASDVPSEGDAHAELRLRRRGDQYDPKHKVKSATFKLELKQALAKSLRVLIQP